MRRLASAAGVAMGIAGVLAAVSPAEWMVPRAAGHLAAGAVWVLLCGLNGLRPNSQ